MSARLPSVSGREAVLVFTKVGFVLLKKRGKGSHMFLRREVDKRKLTVPDHDPLKPGTLRALIRHAGMTVEEFVSLL